MLRRINLYGGPGCGKSTAAAAIFSLLKDRGIVCEWVQEAIKLDAYRKIPALGYDQFLLYAKQLSMEDTFLRNGVDVVVNDAPLWLSTFYARLNKAEYTIEPLEVYAVEFEQQYPAVHIFLDRADRPYKEKGRYQNKEQAFALDEQIKGYVERLMELLSDGLGQHVPKLHVCYGVQAAMDTAVMLAMEDTGNAYQGVC